LADANRKKRTEINCTYQSFTNTVCGVVDDAVNPTDCFLWPTLIVGKVWRKLFLLTGGGTHQVQIAFGRLQYRAKTRVLDDIRPPFTLLFFQFSIDSILSF